MTFHLHLRAVLPTDLRPDPAWLDAVMSAALDDHAAEHVAGIAASIEKDFAGVNQLYTGAPDGPADDADPSGLPIHGGRLVERVDDPPFVLLEARQVGEAASFLGAVDFDELWKASGDALRY